MKTNPFGNHYTQGKSLTNAVSTCRDLKETRSSHVPPPLFVLGTHIKRMVLVGDPTYTVKVHMWHVWGLELMPGTRHVSLRSPHSDHRVCSCVFWPLCGLWSLEPQNIYSYTATKKNIQVPWPGSVTSDDLMCEQDPLHPPIVACVVQRSMSPGAGETVQQ